MSGKGCVWMLLVLLVKINVNGFWSGYNVRGGSIFQTVPRIALRLEREARRRKVSLAADAFQQLRFLRSLQKLSWPNYFILWAIIAGKRKPHGNSSARAPGAGGNRGCGTLRCPGIDVALSGPPNGPRGRDSRPPRKAGIPRDDTYRRSFGFRNLPDCRATPISRGRYAASERGFFHAGRCGLGGPVATITSCGQLRGRGIIVGPVGHDWSGDSDK